MNETKRFLPNEPKRKSPERTANAKAKEQMKKQVKLEPFQDPPELKPGMLFQVKWDDVWYACRYLTQYDGSAVAYSFVDGAFTPIDLDEDEWTFGPYPSVQHGDYVDVEEIDTRVQEKWEDIDVHWEQDDSRPDLLLPSTIKDDALGGSEGPMIPQEEVLCGAKPTRVVIQSVQLTRGTFAYRKQGSVVDLTCSVWYERYKVINQDEENTSDAESDLTSEEDDDDELTVKKDGRIWYVVEGVSGGESKESVDGPPQYTLLWVEDKNVQQSISKSKYMELMFNPLFSNGDKVFSKFKSRNGKDLLVATVIDCSMKDNNGTWMYQYRVKIKDKAIQKMWESDMVLKIRASPNVEKDSALNEEDLSSEDSSSDEDEQDSVDDDEIFSALFPSAYEIGSSVIILTDQIASWVLRAPTSKPWVIKKREVDSNKNIVYTVQRGEFTKKVPHGDVDIPSEDNTFLQTDIVKFKIAPSWGLFDVTDVDADAMTVSVFPRTNHSFNIPEDSPPFERQVLGRASAGDGFDHVPQQLFELGEDDVPPPQDDEIDLDIPYGGVDKYIKWEGKVYTFKKVEIEYEDREGQRITVAGNENIYFGTLISTRCTFEKMSSIGELIIEHGEGTGNYMVKHITGTTEEIGRLDGWPGWPKPIVYDELGDEEEEGEFDELASGDDVESGGEQ